MTENLFTATLIDYTETEHTVTLDRDEVDELAGELSRHAGVMFVGGIPCEYRYALDILAAARAFYEATHE